MPLRSSIGVPMVMAKASRRQPLNQARIGVEKGIGMPFVATSGPTCLSGVTPKCSYHTNTSPVSGAVGRPLLCTHLLFLIDRWFSFASKNRKQVKPQVLASNVLVALVKMVKQVN